MEERLEKMQKEVSPIPIMHRIFAFHVPQTYYREFSFESVLLQQVAALSALREENEELREQNTSLSLVITKMAEKAGKTTRV